MELTTLSYLDLVIQIALFCTLILDYFLVKKKNLKQHGTLMTGAFVVSTILMLGLMLQPFLGETTEILENLLEAESLLFLSHHALGIVAELLGGFLALRWIFRAFNASFCKGKSLMRATLSIWLLSILSGIILFTWHFMG